MYIGAGAFRALMALLAGGVVSFHLIRMATTVPGRSALLDGFGLVALASMFPMITVMGYAQIGAYLGSRSASAPPKAPDDGQEGTE